MKKVLQIGLKDLLIIFRDPAALLLMLLAPYLLTLGLGAVTGNLGSGESSGIEAIPVVLVNHDEGLLGQALINAFDREELADVIRTSVLEDEAAARQQVDDDEATAVVIIPANFSAGILPTSTGEPPEESFPLELYANPTRPIGAGIVEAILADFINRAQSRVRTIGIIVGQLFETGRITPPEVAALVEELGRDIANTESDSTSSVTLERVQSNEQEEESGPNALTLLAPGMAVFFLIFTVTTGARGILTEWEEGTLPRLLTTPTRISEVLGGKTLGIFLTGVLQLSVLILASALMFRLDWGNPLAVLLLILSLSAAATGWGLLLAAFSKTATQVASLGGAMMLLFGILGGSLVTLSFTGIMNIISHLTPNAWATDGFRVLANGGTLVDILPIVGALLLMAAVLFGVSNFTLLRRWV